MTPAEIKTLRKQAGITQAELARRIGCHVQSVKKWERGESRPSAAALFALRSIFGGLR